MSFYKGSNIDQDGRFKNKDKIHMQQINFPQELDIKIDLQKVELDIINYWINQKIISLLGFEDDSLSNYIFNLLPENVKTPKKLYTNLIHFLEGKTNIFMRDLWLFLDEAQRSPSGIPCSIIEDKKDEIRKKILFLESNLTWLESFFKIHNFEMKDSRSSSEDTYPVRKKDRHESKESRRKRDYNKSWNEDKLNRNSKHYSEDTYRRSSRKDTKRDDSRHRKRRSRDRETKSDRYRKKNSKRESRSNSSSTYKRPRRDKGEKSNESTKHRKQSHDSVSSSSSSYTSSR